MSNPLITARDAFTHTHPEARYLVNGRDWGGIRVGETGPALILIPGTLGRADVFWQQLEALQDHARILSLSYPATGGIADWANDIASLIATENLEGAVVLGSSLGGYLAQYLAGVHANLLGGLVAANTLPSVIGIDQIAPYKFDLQTTRIEDLRTGFSSGISQWITPENPYSDLAELLLLEVEGRILEPELRQRLEALKSGPELPACVLPSAKIFTVESGDDHLIPPDWQKAVRARLQPARAYRLKIASHFPYVTRPREYSAMLKEILGLPSDDSPWPIGPEAIL